MSKKKEKPTLPQLFRATFLLSAFTFGGGYVIVSLMKKQFVDDYKWIEEDEMLDLVAIAQSSPGVIAVNGAIVIGYKFYGFLGVLTTVLATILPPFFIISVIYFFYHAFKTNPFIAMLLTGMQAGVGSIIFSVTYDMATKVFKIKSPLLICIMLTAFVLNTFFKVSVIYIILSSAVIGIIIALGHTKGWFK